MRIFAVKVGIYSLCAAQLFFGTAHGAENPANGLLVKTFEFGDSGVCAANFIERELDWSGAERVAGFGRVNSSDGWKKGEGVYRFACIDDGHDFTVAEGGAGAKMLQCNKKYAG